MPCILHWNSNHYVVLYKVKKGKNYFVPRNDTYYISDPAHGLLEYSQEEFLKFWIGNNATTETEEGIALLLEPTVHFHQSEFESEEGCWYLLIKKIQLGIPITIINGGIIAVKTVIS